MTEPAPAPPRWLTRTVVAIIAATFFSDLSHEMATAVLPLYLASLQLGPGALGLIEGIADFVVSFSKLAGGYLGHRVREKRPWASLGYVMTAVATAGLALVGGVVGLVTLRSLAWIGRGFRGPLRDAVLADEVPPSSFGRAYGLERAGDMLGAVAGPLVAVLVLAVGVEYRTVLLVTLIPGLMAAAAMFFFTRERPHVATPTTGTPAAPHRFPRRFWWFLGGVALFGLGDFSRTFLIWLAARAFGEEGRPAPGTLSLAVLLYMGHNLISAAVAYPVGFYGDRRSKPGLLLVGYGLGVLTNLTLALFADVPAGLVVAVVMSGVYIAVEETLEKAAAAEMLPRELRSLGFGIMACVNAVGDMVSSVFVGSMLQHGHETWAFGAAAAVGVLGVTWLAVLVVGRGRGVK